MSEEPQFRYRISHVNEGFGRQERWAILDTTIPDWKQEGCVAEFYVVTLARKVFDWLNEQEDSSSTPCENKGDEALELDETGARIVKMCDEVKFMLLDKNRKYGNSALEPVRVFSKSDALEQIRVRMDDKLSRIRNAQADDDEDAYMDLVGYLVLYLVARGRMKQ